ncbi:unnamed protein product [Urochloa humidicola]
MGSSSDVEVVDVDSDKTSVDRDEEVNVKIVHNHSNFGPHPDDLGGYLLLFCMISPPPTDNCSCTKLNGAISRCKDTFFQGWEVDMSFWTKSFQIGLGASCHKNNSGLFATHYARAYNGVQLLWGMKKSEHALNQAEVLYQLLAMDRNCGAIPSLMIDPLDI